MSLAKIEISNVRNIETATLEPSPRLNFIFGANASGKTSLLEAIFLLGRARSFRTAQVNQLIRFGQAASTVGGRIRSEGGFLLPVGIQITRGQREIHLGGKKIQSSAELIRAFPVLVIQPASTTLLEDGPKYRRQFLDWGVFHAEHSFLDCWRRYIKALSQRNTLLREKRPGDLELWNHELARYGTIVADARQRYAERLRPFLQETAGRFFPGSRFEMQASAGWNEAKSLEFVLREEIPADLRYGYTQSGPHKGDFSISVDGRSAKAYLSRGQTKLLIYALLLAQSQLMEEGTASTGCVLIDDVASELDENNKQRLLGFLKERQSQFFITTTAKPITEGVVDEEAAFIHVEHGRIT
jgi:DNA replication and repair protein RecF